MNKKPNYRLQRIADQIQQELAQLLQFETRDERLKAATIVGVEVSKDLSHAKVFFSVLDVAELPLVEEGFKKAAGFFRSELASLIELRTMPKLSFIYDESVSRGQRISALIDTALARDEEIKNSSKDKN